MSKQNEGHNQQAENSLQAPSPPQQSQAKGGQPERQIEVEEPHGERVAVRQHRDTRSEKPGRPAACGSDERKNSPKKDEHAKRHHDFFGGRKSQKIRGMQQHPVKQHIIPLPYEVEARRLALLNQLGQPGVVHMAGEITGLNMPVPKTGHDDGDGDDRDRPFFFADESPSLRWLPRIPCHLHSRKVNMSPGKRRGAILLSSEQTTDTVKRACVERVRGGCGTRRKSLNNSRDASLLSANG